MPGRPDFLFRAEKVAVFVHGCFWHGCQRCYRPPKSNRSFWRRKLAENRSRDRRAARLLRDAGYSVLVVWEHDLSDARWMARLKARLGGPNRKG